MKVILHHLARHKIQLSNYPTSDM